MCGGSRPGEAVRWVWRRADQSPAPMFSTLRFGHLARGYSNVNPCGPVSPGVARCVEAVPVRIHPLLEVGRLPARGSRLPRPDVQCEAEACPGDSTPPAHTTLQPSPRRRPSMDQDAARERQSRRTGRSGGARMVGASRQQIPLNAASATSGDAAERPLSERLGIADASGCGPSRSLRKRAVLLTETSRQRGAEEEREVEDRRCPWGESDQTCDAWSDSASGCDCA
jgi:hypothetical protein